MSSNPLEIFYFHPDGDPTPVENFVDSLFSNLNFSVGPISVPLGTILAAPLHLFAYIIDLGIAFVNILTRDAREALSWLGNAAWTVINEVAQEVIHDAENLFNFALGFARDLLNQAIAFANSVGQAVLGDAENLFNSAVGLARTLVDGAINVANTIGQEVLDDAKQLFNVAVSTAHDLVQGAIDIANAIGQEVIHDAENLFNIAEHAASDLVQQLERTVDALVSDARAAFEDGLHALESDVIDPLLHTVDQVVGELAGPVKDAVGIVEAVADWLKWLAGYPFQLVRAGADFLAGGDKAGVLSAMRDRYASDGADILGAVRDRWVA